MAQAGVQLPSTDERKSLIHEQQQEINIPIAHPKPCSDLLTGPRNDYIRTAVPLYEASIKGDWKTAKQILDERPELVRYSITENGETALHVAVSTKCNKQVEDFVGNLMAKMTKSDLELENKSSNTALSLAAAAGNLKMVKMMVEKNRALVEITGSQQMPPLYLAALFGHYKVVKYLYQNSHKLRDDCWTSNNRGWLLVKCVEGDMFDIALDIVQEHPGLNSNGSVLGVLATKADVFAETESNILMRAINWVFHPKMQAHEKENKAYAIELLKNIWRNTAEKSKIEIDSILRGPRDSKWEPHNDRGPLEMEDQTLELLRLISENIVEKQKTKEPASTVPENSTPTKYSSRILFTAAEVGNTRFLVELIGQYPDLVWKVNGNGESIFHVAVRHRQLGVYNLLHEIGSMKDLITPIKDINGNTMLHIVARRVDRKRLEDVSGGAFQMQRELLWFKEIEQIMPPTYRLRRNKDGLTARELFTREHQNLVGKGESWMKGTASQCMVVATLIATIVFAAAFTVPGGYSQNEGIPFFYKNTSFLIFVVADAISLFSSAASILTFLSILTSGYAENDFLESLPRRLMLGVATLYISITTMVISFSVTFFVLYRNNLKWIPILVTLIATMPVVLFAMLQYRLLRDVIHSTYGSSYLFRPKKRVLYP